jgi:hypothetical protein
MSGHFRHHSSAVDVRSHKDLVDDTVSKEPRRSHKDLDDDTVSREKPGRMPRMRTRGKSTGNEIGASEPDIVRAPWDAECGPDA